MKKNDEMVMDVSHRRPMPRLIKASNCENWYKLVSFWLTLLHIISLILKTKQCKIWSTKHLPSDVIIALADFRL